MEKKMSAGAFVLKGTGWYATDYAHKGNGNGAKKPASCPASKGEASPPACAGCPKAE
jgi:predicted nucleic acid-binding Zn ribbon protein